MATPEESSNLRRATAVLMRRMNEGGGEETLSGGVKEEGKGEPDSLVGGGVAEPASTAEVGR